MCYVLLMMFLGSLPPLVISGGDILPLSACVGVFTFSFFCLFCCTRFPLFILFSTHWYLLSPWTRLWGMIILPEFEIRHECVSSNNPLFMWLIGNSSYTIVSASLVLCFLRWCKWKIFSRSVMKPTIRWYKKWNSSISNPILTHNRKKRGQK